ncbi:IS21 family transposase [Microbulbifer spongiae]|uniref:IS21 family transposase n=1 Tax=Microbulbifer spongiae TaxID=2944933 RepID=A0ABY9EDE5_9GAMM|nr:IS21 family transposase [Microbulbifer sp. MI-G]WKD51043.1 IS21 family transposase [Microbulbifer sp. MI-G]
MKLATNTFREVLRLSLTTDFSATRLGEILGVATNTVLYYRKQLDEVDVTWDQLKELSDSELAMKFMVVRERDQNKVMPDFADYEKRKLHNKYLTNQVLWEEYKSEHKSDGYSYSQFNHYYQQYRNKVRVTERIQHYPGEILFVDYAGTTVPWKDKKTGKVMKAQVFVAVLGCSNYTFVWASKSQKVEDWIEGHVQTLHFIGGVPESIVCDNLKSGVNTPGKNFELNRIYQEMACHYSTVILPARVRKPQDKAKAEQGVLHISRWILAPLRERIFFSVEEINQAIQTLLPVVNSRPFKDLPGNRQSRFEEIDKPALRPLPAQRFEYAQWVAPQKVRDDYHIKVMKHFYSVPFQLVGERVEARVTSKVVDLYHDNKRVASHLRSFEQGGATVDKRHMAPQHLACSDQGLESYLAWAKRFGPATQAVVRAQYEGKRSNSFIANQACSALRSLARQYDPAEFEAACKRAQAIASMRLSSVKSILRTGLYKQDADFKPVQSQLPLHENIRGASYYAQGGL